MGGASQKQDGAHKGDERFDVETHFAFGRNWADYAQHITQDEIDRAREGFSALVPQDVVRGVRMLDIGCGSGLHSLAALQLGARAVTCVDIDPDSVNTARGVLERFAPGAAYDVFACNILEPDYLRNLPGPPYDLVYSWGVLHHTGDMKTAIAHAAALVAPGGHFALALYKKTPLCGFWRAEKKFYTAAPRWLRRAMDGAFAAFYALGLLAGGQNPVRYIRGYNAKRGMHFMTDIRDWLGGYPYESIAPRDVEGLMRDLGFRPAAQANTRPVRAFGLFGSGCAEYVFIKH